MSFFLEAYCYRSISKVLSILGGVSILLCLLKGEAVAHSYEAELCLHATGQVERALQIPDGFLSAISRVESGRPDNDGTIAPWPWTVTAAGVGHYYATREEAVEAVEKFRKQGIFSLDVGCMQVNLQQHPDAFVSVQQAFDPMYNAQYAGEFLLRLHEKMGSWPHAAAAYHSQTPSIGAPYQWKVLEAWSEPQDGRFITHAMPKIVHRYSVPSLPVVVVSNRPRFMPYEQPSIVSPSYGVYGGGVHHYFKSLHTQTDQVYAHSMRNFRPYVESTHISGVFQAHGHVEGEHDRHLSSYRESPVALAVVSPPFP